MTTPSASVEIYCVKCKAKTASRDIEAVTMKNGRPATRGPAARLPMANGPGPLPSLRSNRRWRVGAAAPAPGINPKHRFVSIAGRRNVLHGEVYRDPAIMPLPGRHCLRTPRQQSATSLHKAESPP